MMSIGDLQDFAVQTFQQSATSEEEEAEDEISEFEEAEEMLSEEEKEQVAREYEHEEIETEESDEAKAKRYQEILTALGFKCYDNAERGVVYKQKIGNLQVARQFDKKYPLGRFWVRITQDCEWGKAGEFLPVDKLREVPIIKLFDRIRDGELPMPEPQVTGHVIEKTEKAVRIEFEEFGEVKSRWWGCAAVKRNEKGMRFIPAGFSRQTEKHEAKMVVPRDILLPDYERELEEAPLKEIEYSQEQYYEPEAPAQTQMQAQPVSEEELKQRLETNMRWAVKVMKKIYTEEKIGELIGKVDAATFLEKTAISLFIAVSRQQRTEG